MNEFDCPLCLGKETYLFERVKQNHSTDCVYYRCKVCDLIFVDPAAQIPEANEREFYEQHQNDVTNTGYVKLLNELLRPLKLYLPDNAKILDFGCGPGPTVARLLAADGYQVTNYDKYFFADEKLLQYSGYDCLTATEVIEHFAEPGGQFAQMLQLVRPGGILAVMTQVLPKGKSFADWYYHRDPTHLTFYSEDTFQFMAEKFNLQMLYGRGGVRIFQVSAH